MKPLVFINSHPIQYFVPLYQEISAKTELQLTVWYCSSESVKGDLDVGFGTNVKWDIPLLEGYNYRFIKNNSWKPSINKGFWGLQNWSIIKMLYKQPRSIIVVHGWAYLSNVVAIVVGRLFGHTVCIRAETPWNQEKVKVRVLTFFKHIYLRFLFLFVDRFLFIGTQNKLFYLALGVQESRLVYTPYAVDNTRFSNLNARMTQSEAREKLDLPLNKKIILFSGKYIHKKRPIDLIQALERIKNENVFLIFVGDGELRISMEKLILESALVESVLLTGFVNQSEIPHYYKAADIFVMCSGIGETWGLSVNEAMNFGLPVIVSDVCGCVDDLIIRGVNGDVFETGNVIELSELLIKYVNASVGQRELIQASSINKVSEFSYCKIIAGLEKIIVN